MLRKEVTRRLSSTSEDTPREKSTKKTWQIIFHTSKIPTEENLVVKFSLLANNGKDQTEFYEINIKEFKKIFKSEKQFSFSVQLKNIGQPDQIRLKMQTTDDDQEEEDIKWHLDQVQRESREKEI